MDNVETRFFIFGQGNRRKFLYKNGKLVDLSNGTTLLQVKVARENIIEHEYRVELLSTSGDNICITEEETGITIVQNGCSESLAKDHVKLPRFENHRYEYLLRILQH